MLVNDKRGSIKLLADALIKLHENTTLCNKCGVITEKNNNPCKICTNTRRNNGLICIVETSEELFKIESSKLYDGKYHVLMGKLSPITGIGLNDLRINELLKILNEEEINEIIFSLDNDVESIATMNYLKELLESYEIKLTCINNNLFNGDGLEYIDSDLLGEALVKRLLI